MRLSNNLIIHRSPLIPTEYYYYLFPQAIGQALNGMILRGADMEENTRVYDISRVGTHRIYIQAHVICTL